MTTEVRSRGEVQAIIEEVTAGANLARFAVREDTNDSALVRGILGGREYPFERMQNLTGWALDIGAHIGIVTVALALDNPTLHIVAVEALAENVEMLRRNVRINRLEDRVEVVEAAAGTDGPTDIGWDYSYIPEESDEANKPGGYVEQSRFIGNIYSPRERMVSKIRCVMGLSLDSILGRFAIARVSFMKIDCEGCEWVLLKDPAVARIDRIIGEAHGDPRFPGLVKLLAKTHTVLQLDDNPVNPIFEAIRR